MSLVKLKLYPGEDRYVYLDPKRVASLWEAAPYPWEMRLPEWKASTYLRVRGGGHWQVVGGAEEVLTALGLGATDGVE
jgi:hypothetical protein